MYLLALRDSLHTIIVSLSVTRDEDANASTTWNELLVDSMA